MAFDSHANFAYGTVLTAPSPASSGTSLVLNSGQGALFPAVPFNATVWPAGVQPTSSNAEIVRVTNISTDTLTITRAQESTSARTIVVGDQFAATITKKVLTDIEAPATGTEILAMIASQINVSSIGDTYTDVAGNTFAETTHQTRITLDGTRIRSCMLHVSGHVSAGTGSFQHYNFTDSAQLSVQTTTSTSEVVITRGSSSVSTNLGDAITMRVKNSGVGGTVTIDAGGMIEGDSVSNTSAGITATGKASMTTPIFAGWPSSIQIALLKVSTGATITAQPQANIAGIGDTSTLGVNIGATVTTSDANTIATRTPVTKVFATAFHLNVSAISGTYEYIMSYQVKADNIP